MPQCEEYELLISRALDGEADETELQALHAHLEQCPACRRLWEEFALLRQAVAPPLPPEALEEKIMAEVRREAAARNRPRKLRRWSWGLATAACLAVVLLALPRILPGRPESGAPAGAACTYAEGAAPEDAAPTMVKAPDQEESLPQDAAGAGASEKEAGDASAGAAAPEKEPAPEADDGDAGENRDASLEALGELFSQFPMVPDLFSQVQAAYLERDGGSLALSERDALLSLLAPDEDLEETALPSRAAELLFRLEQQDAASLRAEVWELDTGALAVRLTQEGSLLRCYACAPGSVSALESLLSRAGL